MNMAEDMKDLERMIGKVPKFFKELTVNDPKMFEMVMKLEGHIWDDGALTRKTKKLIAIAIAASLRDQHAVHAQLIGASNSESRKKRSRRRSGCHSCSQVCPPTSMGKPSLTK